MSDPTYSDDEVHRILARAAESETRLPPTEPQAGRWSLAEIQRVGEEAGLSPSAVASAALAERSGGADVPAPSVMGLPLAASHEVPLARPLADEEWHRLVLRLRETFSARGREESHGLIRQWSNGNLRVSHDVEGDVAVLRMRTMKGDGRPFVLGGLLTALSTAAIGATLWFTVGGDERRLFGLAVLGLLGAATAAYSAFRLPWWVRERHGQFEAMGEFARRLSEAPRQLRDGG